MREKFEKICRDLIKRDGIEDLLSSLAKSDFYTAPGSTKYHDSDEGGLARHSVKVFSILESDLDGHKEYTKESVAIVSLFHDLCKVNYYKIEMRNAKNETTGKWEKVPYYTVDDQFPYGHGEKSVLLVSEKMKLTASEMMAIRHHMGAYEGQQHWNTLSKAYDMYPLALHLHIADMKATYLK